MINNKKIYKISIIILLLVSLFFDTTILEAASKNADSEIIQGHLFFLFLLGSYFLAVTLAYKRFVCRGKYGNPLLHSIFLVMFLVLIPYAWIYLIIFEPIFIILGKKRGKEITSLAQLGINISGLPELKNLSPIIIKDNGFNKNKFLEMAKKTFFTIYGLRAKGDFSEAEDLVSDGLYEHFSQELNSLKQIDASLIIEKPEIDRIVICGIETSKYYNNIYVAISGASTFYRKEKYKKRIYGEAFVPSWIEEIWRFSRKEGEYSENEWFLTGIAPQHYFIRSGKSSKKHKNEEYYNKKITGLKEMVSKDPQFCINDIEDRMYVIFWGIYYAIQYLDSSFLKSFCTPDFIKEFEPSGKIDAFPVHRVINIDQVSLKAIIVGKGNYDHIVFQINWVGKKQFSDFHYNDEKTLFILRRNKKALSSSENNYNSLHCPNCGEKIKTDSNRCSNCNEILNNDAKYWVLESVISPTKISIYNLNDMAFNQKPSSVDSVDFSNIDFRNLENIYGEDLIKMTIAIMLADGIIDKNELRAIIEIAAKKRIKPEQVQNMIKEIQAQPDPVNYTLNNTSIPKDMTLLLLLVNIAACDGKITDDEAQLLYKISDRMNVHRKLLYDMINSAYQSKAL